MMQNSFMNRNWLMISEWSEWDCLYIWKNMKWQNVNPFARCFAVFWTRLAAKSRLVVRPRRVLQRRPAAAATRMFLLWDTQTSPTSSTSPTRWGWPLIHCFCTFNVAILTVPYFIFIFSSLLLSEWGDHAWLICAVCVFSVSEIRRSVSEADREASLSAQNPSAAGSWRHHQRKRCEQTENGKCL